MKAGPLKNKLIRNYPKQDYFSSTDVASAVAWLKKEIKWFHMDKDILIRKIDEAFADVVKEK